MKLSLRLSPRHKAALAVAFALLLWMPQGISTHDQTVVTGHSTFYNGETYDQCMASIAGILRSRVLWFNDMVLAERYAGKGTFIYVTEDGADDPTQKRTLYTEGVFYDFVDPNGAHWHVEEAFYYESLAKGSMDIGDPLNDDPVNDDDFLGYRVTDNRTYVWIVELAARPIHDAFAGANPEYFHDLYNFLIMVDTCKMHRENSYHGNETHAGQDLSTEFGHPAGATEHEHETHLVNIWVGKRPTLAPLGASGDGLTWQSSWATGQATGQSGPSSGGGSS